MADDDSILEELGILVGQELKPVTYKWLARNFGLHVNAAKRLLQSFASKHEGKLRVTYLLSGVSKETHQQLVQLVDDKQLAGAKDQFSDLTSDHIYSVAPPEPSSNGLVLWQVNYAQNQEYMSSLLSGKAGPADERLAAFTKAKYSAVKGPEGGEVAKRPPSRPPLAAVENVEEQNKTAAAATQRGSRANGGSAAAAQPQFNGTTASHAAAAQQPQQQQQPPSMSATEKATKGAASGGANKGPVLSGYFQKGASGKASDKPSGKASGGTDQPTPAQEATATGTNRSGEVPAVQTTWGKPVTQQQQKPSGGGNKQQQQPQPSKQEQPIASDDDEDAIVVTKRGGSKRNRNVALDDDEEELPAPKQAALPGKQTQEEEESPNQDMTTAGSKPGKGAGNKSEGGSKAAGGRKRKADAEQNDGEPSKSKAKPTSKAAKSAAASDVAEGNATEDGAPSDEIQIVDESATASKKTGKQQKAKQAKGSKPAATLKTTTHSKAAPKRRKMEKTYYNDKGEEVTIEVEVDENGNEITADNSLAMEEPKKVQVPEQPPKPTSIPPSKPSGAASAANNTAATSAAAAAAGRQSASGAAEKPPPPVKSGQGATSPAAGANKTSGKGSGKASGGKPQTGKQMSIANFFKKS